MNFVTTKENARDRILDAALGLIFEHGFNATTLDSILDKADASKGAFFHHFDSKDKLGEAILDQYAADDAATAREMMEKAESLTDDPAEQVVLFVKQFADMADDLTANNPGCLFVSFIYERGPGGSRENDVIVESIELWRDLVLEKLEKAAGDRPELGELDLPSLADMVFSTFEGGFILSRATGDRRHLGLQLRHLQRYLELLLEVAAPI